MLFALAQVDRDLFDGQAFYGGNKATVLHAVIDRYVAQSNVTIEATQTVDNPAMVMSLVASTRGLALIPAYVENLMPLSVVSRPLAGDRPSDAPIIALALGYSKADTSPILRLFLSRVDELIARAGHAGTHHS